MSLFPAFVFTQATSQSPCLHETLATAAITIRNSQSVFLIVIHVMGFSLLSEMEFFAVPKNGISLNI